MTCQSDDIPELGSADNLMSSRHLSVMRFPDEPLDALTAQDFDGGGSIILYRDYPAERTWLLANVLSGTQRLLSYSNPSETPKHMNEHTEQRGFETLSSKPHAGARETVLAHANEVGVLSKPDARVRLGPSRGELPPPHSDARGCMCPAARFNERLGVRGAVMPLSTRSRRLLRAQLGLTARFSRCFPIATFVCESSPSGRQGSRCRA
ncbi:hypothetical protein LZ30DRAFT_11629 [Colletotrichum cereale]|nr:hypothetical protein LZ30DRAFT_11629 [Colletotrichum cereale]